MPEHSDIFRAPRGNVAGAATAEDLVVSHAAYLDEIHAALQRAEEAFRGGDNARAAELAWEGLETIRISVPRLGAQNVPAYYAAFFHCFRMQEPFRQALRLYKQGTARRGRHRPPDREPLTRAWQQLEPSVACLDERLPVERLVFEFPVAGRLLRGVVRLREKLREALAAAGE